MTAPDHLWCARLLNRPEVDFILTGGRELLVMLPYDINDLAGLIKFVHRIFLDRAWVPDNDAGVLTTRCNKRVRLVPRRADEPVLRAEETLESTIHGPDACEVIVGAGEQPIASMTPLN